MGSLNIMGVLLIKSSGETHVSPLTSVGMDSLSPNIIETQVCQARSQQVPAHSRFLPQKINLQCAITAKVLPACQRKP